MHQLRLQSFLTLILFSTIQCIEKVKNNKAKVYGSDGFDRLKVTTNSKYLLMFYAPWCGHCTKAQTLWDEMAGETYVRQKQVLVGKVDCTKFTHFCAGENIKSYPTMKYFRGIEKWTYRGHRNREGLSDFIKKPVTNPAEQQHQTQYRSDLKQQLHTGVPAEEAVFLTQQTFDAAIGNEDDVTFVNFFAPWCSHCRQLAPVWNQLAETYQDSKVIIAKVDCVQEKPVCEKWKINGYPSLKLFAKGDLVTEYSGQRAVLPFKHFVDLHSENFNTKNQKWYKRKASSQKSRDSTSDGEEEAEEEAEEQTPEVEDTPSDDPADDDSSDDPSDDPSDDGTGDVTAKQGGRMSLEAALDGNYPQLTQDEIDHLLQTEELWLNVETFYRLSDVKCIIFYMHSQKVSHSVDSLAVFRRFSKMLRQTEIDLVPSMINCDNEYILCGAELQSSEMFYPQINLRCVERPTDPIARQEISANMFEHERVSFESSEIMDWVRKQRLPKKQVGAKKDGDRYEL